MMLMRRFSLLGGGHKCHWYFSTFGLLRPAGCRNAHYRKLHLFRTIIVYHHLDFLKLVNLSQYPFGYAHGRLARMRPTYSLSLSIPIRPPNCCGLP